MGGGSETCRKFEGFVGNLGGFAPPHTGKSEFPPLILSAIGLAQLCQASQLHTLWVKLTHFGLN